MSGTSSPHGGLTRRTFLKASGATAGALGLAGAAGMVAAEGWLAPAKAYAETEDRQVSVCHKYHCSCCCSLRTTVRDGRIVKLEPNSWKNPKFNTICLKGIAEIERVYGVERLQTPLRRIGERGSGEFVSITWEEAFDEIGEKLGQARKSYGNDSVLVAASSAAQANLLPALLQASVLPLGSGIDIGMGNGLDPLTGFIAGWCSNSTDNWKSASTLLVLGANNLETKLVFAQNFFKAKDAGCHIVVVDPMFSTTASKADEWIGIAPGTDLALLLGMISLTIDNEWHDEEFMKANTGFPFLVDVKTGKLLSRPTEGVPAVGESGAPNPGCMTYFVWDEVTSSVKPATDKAVNPSLVGSFQYEGNTYRTVFDLLVESQKEYPLDWASGRTGIAEEQIRKLTEQYATAGPATLQLGLGGPDKYSNADVVGHAAGILAVLTGNVGVLGGGVGVAEDWAFDQASLGSWPLPDEFVPVPSQVQYYDLSREKNNIHAIVSFGSPFDMWLANFGAVEQWIKTLDFIAVADIYNTPSMAYADIVLPVCSPFESAASINSVVMAGNRIMLREKAIEPLFESKTDFDIECGIAKSLGFEKYLPTSIEEYVEARLATGVNLPDVTLDSLHQEGGICLAIDFEEPIVTFRDQQYMTKSGKAEPYYENLFEFGQALPKFEEQKESYAGNPLKEKYPLSLIQTRSRFYIHNEFCDAKWIRQFREQSIEMNPADMRSRQLENNEVVSVFNDRGSFACKVVGNESVRCGCARIIEGVWSKFFEEGGLQNVTNDEMNERGYSLAFGPVIPFNDTLVQIKKA